MAGITLAVVSCALLALSITGPIHWTGCSLASSLLRTIVVCLCLPVSHLSRYKSSRPPVSLCLFLSIDLLSNIARCQEMWLAAQGADDETFVAIFTVYVVLEVGFLSGNLIWQPKWLSSWDRSNHSPEETSNIFGLGLYTWVNRLIWTGYQRNLVLEDLFPLDRALSADSISCNPATKHSANKKPQSGSLALLSWTAKPLLRPLLLPVFPRLCLVGFTLC